MKRAHSLYILLYIFRNCAMLLHIFQYVISILIWGHIPSSSILVRGHAYPQQQHIIIRGHIPSRSILIRDLAISLAVVA